jgi:hypothetical protein
MGKKQPAALPAYSVDYLRASSNTKLIKYEASQVLSFDFTVVGNTLRMKWVKCVSHM